MSDTLVCEWVDITSRSRHEKDLTPRTWEFRLRSGLRIVLTRTIYSPDTWLLRTYPEICAEVDLGSMPIESAKPRAIGLVEGRIQALAAELAAVKT